MTLNVDYSDFNNFIFYSSATERLENFKYKLELLEYYTSQSLVVAQLLFLESDNPDADILFYINSPGGSVTAGMSIYDTMQYITPQISTIVMGQAASMGSLLAQAGATGKRYILPNARHMIHQPSGGARGMQSDIEIQYKEITFLKKNLIRIYRDHNTADKTYAQLEVDMDRDFFMSAEQSVAYGLADKIITNRN